MQKHCKGQDISMTRFRPAMLSCVQLKEKSRGNVRKLTEYIEAIPHMKAVTFRYEIVIRGCNNLKVKSFAVEWPADLWSSYPCLAKRCVIEMESRNEYLIKRERRLCCVYCGKEAAELFCFPGLFQEDSFTYFKS